MFWVRSAWEERVRARRNRLGHLHGEDREDAGNCNRQNPGKTRRWVPISRNAGSRPSFTSEGTWWGSRGQKMDPGRKRVVGKEFGMAAVDGWPR